MFKVFHCLLSINIQNLFQIDINIHVQVGEKTFFHLEYSRTILWRQCASNAGIRLWNSLPDNITIIGLYFQYICLKDISSPVIEIVLKLMCLFFKLKVMWFVFELFRSCYWIIIHLCYV